MTSTFVDHSFFFTALERDRIARQTPVQSSRMSLTTILLQPFLHLVTALIPDTVAPSAITLCGCIASIQAYYILSQYFAEQPHGATVVAAGLLFFSALCGALDSMQARRCHSGTPLGDIFSRACAAASHVFQALSFFVVLGIDEELLPDGLTAVHVKWYVTSAMLLVEISLILARVNRLELTLSPAESNNNNNNNNNNEGAALRNGTEAQKSPSLKTPKAKAAKVLRDVVSKPVVSKFLSFALFAVRESEISGTLMFLMVLRWAAPVWTVVTLRAWLIAYSRFAYTAAVTMALSAVALSNDRVKSRALVAFCLAIRCMPMIALLPLNATTELTLMADAFVFALIAVELYVSALAQRRLHAAVVAVCVLALVNSLFVLFVVMLYLIGMLADLSYGTGIPLFVPIRNVFIDGVYDLCHVGHKRVMESALQHGNRLVVGVLSDEDCVGYKRRPIMTTEERCREVAMCRYVSEVVPGSPVDGLTEAFLQKHNIHVVVCGEEYNTPTDKYYAVPRKLGMLRCAPRTEGMSTSVLINRIRQLQDDDIVAKDKLRGESAVKDGS